MKRIFKICTIAFLGAGLPGVLAAQSIALRTFRAVAGESRVADAHDGVPAMTAITSAETTPPLEFPIRVEVVTKSEAPVLKLVIPPGTPAGNYTIDIEGRDREGQKTTTTLRLTVDAVTFSRPVAERPPVILLNGFQLSCSDTASTVAASADTFDQLASLLQADGLSVSFFNTCTYGNTVSIEQLAAQLNNYIAGLQYTDGTPVAQVDLVAHSMGGLIVRAYLSGKQATAGVFSPPAKLKIRKVIFLATPHFGSYQANNPLVASLFPSGTQLSEMKPGSQFLWDLATWNQGGDDLRGVDALSVIGNDGKITGSSNLSDGVVSLTSASLRFAQPDMRTRIVPYCHVQTNSGSAIETTEAVYLQCSGPGIAHIDTTAHQSYVAISSFLANTTGWQAVGHPPSQDDSLDQHGGLFVAVQDAQGEYLDDVTSVEVNGAALTPGPSNPVTSVYYDDWLPTGSYSVSTVSTSDGDLTETEVSNAGGYHAVILKAGPQILNVHSRLGTGLRGRTVANGSKVTITGTGFSDGTSLQANGVALSINVVSDKEITTVLPSSLSGLVALTVSNNNGKDVINVMVAAPSPIGYPNPHAHER